MAVAPNPTWCAICASACANNGTTCNEAADRCGDGADQGLDCLLSDIYSIDGGLSSECGGVAFYAGYCASAMDRCDDAVNDCVNCQAAYCAGTGGGGGKLF